MKALTIEPTKFVYFADFAIYLAAIALATILLPLFAPAEVRSALLLAFLAGLATWSLIEYAMHRLVFHGIAPFQRMHGEHHRRPRALIATPTWLSLGLIAVLAWMPAITLAGLWLGSSATLGITVGYFAYGVIHHAVHHWRPASAWMLQRKGLHAIHHRFPHHNYGVTVSLWDLLLATQKASLT